MLPPLPTIHLTGNPAPSAEPAALDAMAEGGVLIIPAHHVTNVASIGRRGSTVEIACATYDDAEAVLSALEAHPVHVAAAPAGPRDLGPAKYALGRALKDAFAAARTWEAFAERAAEILDAALAGEPAGDGWLPIAWLRPEYGPIWIGWDGSSDAFDPGIRNGTASGVIEGMRGNAHYRPTHWQPCPDRSRVPPPPSARPARGGDGHGDAARASGEAGR